MITQKYYVSGMHCASCKVNIENELKKNELIEEASVNYSAETMQVTFNEKELSDGDIQKLVRGIGDYDTRPDNDGGRSKHQKEKNENLSKMKRNLIYVSIAAAPFIMSMAFMLINGIFDLNILGGFSTRLDSIMLFGISVVSIAQIVLAGFVLFVGGRLFFVNAFAAIKKGSSNMDTLVVLGATTAWIYSTIVTIFFAGSEQEFVVFFEASVFIIFFILVGRYFEEKARTATQKSVESLYAIQSKVAVVLRDLKKVEIAIKNVVKKDNVVVMPGQKIPVDGVIIEGKTAIDESMISGEAFPVDKKEGDAVIGGTLNTTGYIVFEATKVGKDTMLSQIIKMVEEAQGSSVPIQKLADKISSIFVPIVIIIAVGTFIFWYFVAPNMNLIEASQALPFAVYVTISVLVIACPCALGLATPTAIIVSVGHAARKGILIKNAQIIENAFKIKNIVFDKTGTITQGKPAVTDSVYFDDEKKYANYVYALENKTEHPVAKAIINFLEVSENNLSEEKVEDFHNLEGVGVRGIIDGEKVMMVKMSSVKEYAKLTLEQKNVTNSFLEKKYTISVFIVGDSIKAIFAVTDPIKETSYKAISALKEKGIKTTMVTGDNENIAQWVASSVGIDNVVSDAVPLDKDRIVQKIKKESKEGELIAVAGDGVNDAPALARADIGIAMGTGSDVAIESGDIVIVKGSLQKIVDAINLSKKTMHIIKQNLFWAFGYNVLAIPIAMGFLYPFFGVVLSPTIASAAMALSSISVVLNSLRLRR
ncbi:MAG: heavy metal translocating P-type ATPase [Candidatus Moraniibacteriota bacterium]